MGKEKSQSNKHKKIANKQSVTCIIKIKAKSEHAILPKTYYPKP